jgi:PIN domain nuclease of toxin-antitoxin system
MSPARIGRRMLATAAISAVNLAEVITILVRRSGGPDAAYSSRLFAYLADGGVSLGDRSCITAGIRFAKIRIAKTDRAWKKVKGVACHSHSLTKGSVRRFTRLNRLPNLHQLRMR